MRKRSRPDYQYYNSLKSTLTKEKIRSGMVIKNLPENLRKLLFFTALKKKCYLENIIELALREYFLKDKTLASFIDCNFEVDFSESFNIRKVDNVIEVNS